MKKNNSNPMGAAANTGSSTKPDAGVLRMMKAKMSPNLNNENNAKVPNQAKLNRPTAKSTPVNPRGPAQPPKTPHAKLNRKARTN